MIKNLKKLTFDNAILLGNMFYLMTISIHVLILTRVIPLKWISGGRISSLSDQLPITLFNLFLSLFGLVFIQWANQSRGAKSVRLVAIPLSVLWAIGFIMQFLGTPFEQFFMSLVLLSGLVSHLRLSINE